MFAMNALTVISTDLLTPLGAYLRLRQGGSASFLLESVEKGRLGRHSFVGCGSRLVAFDEAEACGQPVVGYLGYEHAARLEPTVPVPDEGRDLPESRFVSPTCSSASTTASGWPRCSAATRARSRSCSKGRSLRPSQGRARGRARPADCLRATSTSARSEAGVAMP